MAINCKKRKRVCFHCKGRHNTALCYIRYNDRAQSVGPIKEETNSEKIYQRFQIKSRCSSNLYIEETSKELKSRRYDCEQVKFVDFGNKNPQPSLFAKRLIDSGSCNLEMFKENITK
ncbi:unnamed protein product [Dracunculus medinensis]|uniref:Uncharacterized protein n=1 Tax=Dracunculus medinensis TaxID=318479 RepID=A0A0N4U2J7_DRAME|nr:unnamed protein product [Dracunculus medinensis]